jgi:D-alanine-D-alanine ligase
MQEDPFPNTKQQASQRPSQQPRLNVVLAYNATTAVQRGDATDALPDSDESAILPVISALESLGHRVTPLGLTYENLDELERIECDFVFNLCEGTGLDGHPGLEVVEALDRRGIPFSGAGPYCYWLTTGKWRMKTKLAAAKVPVPLGAVLPGPDVPLPSTMRFPLFVKPRDGFGSLGVHEGSVVHDVESAKKAVQEIVEGFGGYALVEQYIVGREITVGVIGNSVRGSDAQVLPPLEVTFGKAYDNKPKIRMFATKFDESSALYYDFNTVCPAPLTPELDARVRQVALQAYRAVGGDGYARVDMRLAEDGTPYVLEVNSNCSLEHAEHPSDCGMLPLIARAQGWSYADLLGRLIDAGLKRKSLSEKPPCATRWHRGTTAAHALVSCPSGQVMMPFGPVYPSASREPLEGTYLTTSGRRVYVESDVRHLTASEEPNLEAIRVGNALFLRASREIKAGDVLSIDPGAPIDLASPARRPRACGRPLHGEPRVAALVAAKNRDAKTGSIVDTNARRTRRA